MSTLLQVLHFIFRDFWTWLGTVILISAPFCGFRLVNIEKNITMRKGKKDDE